MDETAVIAGYDRILASIGDRAGEIDDRPVVTRWPHISSAYQGLVVVGQAVHGWGDDYSAAHFQTQAGRVVCHHVDRAWRWLIVVCRRVTITYSAVRPP